MERSSSTDNVLPVTSLKDGSGREVMRDVYCFTTQIVNVYFIGNPAISSDWVLIDAGMPESGGRILKEAEKRFGPDHQLKAIVLTHGHFDHVGGIIDILEKFPVPVYAHPLEFPYLQGQKNYPEPDSTVEGGLVAKMSAAFPKKAINISEHLKELPASGDIPQLPDWKWLHTPGHSDGHISLFRFEGRIIIAGDAFVTVKQDSFYKVLIQKKEVCGPPVYLTTNWQAAWESVIKIANLQPSIAATGHGKPMRGPKLAAQLVRLVNYFPYIAVPDYGRFVEDAK